MSTIARRVAATLVTLVLLGAFLAAGAWFARDWYLSQPVHAPVSELFRIEAGEGFGVVARRLERDGWVSSSFPLRVEARWQGWDTKLVPGYYQFHRGETIRELLDRLVEGRIEETLVTIPEGWRLPRILEVLADSTRMPLETYQELAASEELRERLRVPGPSFEGFLLPETYRIPLGETPERVVARLVDAGVAFWEDSLEAKAADLDLDRNEVWSLASVVEAEAGVAEERRRIAAVFWNRLRRGMKLESDPTVLFALDRPPGRVLYRDLEIDSPYNTYRYPGIPPGPICAPGKASLAAVVDPLPDCDDLFFVARGDGTHVFSKTLAAHNRAKSRIKKQLGIR